MRRLALMLLGVVLMSSIPVYGQEVKFARLGPAIGMSAGGDVDNAFAFGLQGEVAFGEH